MLFLVVLVSLATGEGRNEARNDVTALTQPWTYTREVESRPVSCPSVLQISQAQVHATPNFSALQGQSSLSQAEQEVTGNVTGDSTRLGNLIAAWIFASTPQYQNYNLSRHSLYEIEQCPGAMCFGKYLQSRAGPLLSTETLQVVNTMELIKDMENEIYSSKVLKAVVAEAGLALASAMRLYPWFSHTHTQAHIPERGSRHCTVHFRVGDLISYGRMWGLEPKIIAPASVAAAVASFSPHPTSIEILGGGMDHDSTPAEQVKSLAVLESLEREIEAKIPGAAVFTDFNGSADEDWYKMASSPMLVFAVGSFAETAAVAGQNNSVRSPACKNMMYANETNKDEETEIRPGWTTYAYEMQEWR